MKGLRMTPEEYQAHLEKKPDMLQGELQRLKKRGDEADKAGRETESKIQQRGIDMAGQAMELLGFDMRLLMSIPNGADVADHHRMRLVAEGLRSGVPDLFLAYRAGGYGGLWIEVKRPGGKLSRNQEAMMLQLGKEGYLCKIAYSSENIRDLVLDYLEDL